MPAKKRGSAQTEAMRRLDVRKNFFANTGYSPPWWMMEGQQIPGTRAAMATTPPTPQAAPTPYPTHLPTISKGTQQAQAAAPTPYPTYLPTIMRGVAGQAPAGQARGYLPPGVKELFETWFGQGMPAGEEEAQFQTPAEQAGAAVAGLWDQQAQPAGRGGGAGFRSAPPGVNPGWYAQFQKEHGGQTPEEFYAQTGEGLPEAMADLEWSQGFAQMTGRAPSQYDWEEHWYATRGYGRPRQQSPREYAAWQKARKERRRAKKAEEAEPRPPTYMPPQIIWR